MLRNALVDELDIVLLRSFCSTLILKEKVNHVLSCDYWHFFFHALLLLKDKLLLRLRLITFVKVLVFNHLESVFHQSFVISIEILKIPLEIATSLVSHLAKLAETNKEHKWNRLMSLK